MYTKITNPQTGKKVSIYSKGGKTLIRNYLKQIGGAVAELDGTPLQAVHSDGNMPTFNDVRFTPEQITEIQEKLSELRLQAQIAPLKIKTTEEQIKKGAPASFEVPVTFDNSNFFG
jgi:hypothetical protein